MSKTIMLRNEFLILLQNEKIITINNHLGKKYKKLLRSKINILQKIVEFTSFLQYNAPISSRLYCIIKHITQQPICKTCNKPLKMRTTGKAKHTFGKFCGGACIGRNKEVQSKRKKLLNPN